MRGTRQLSVNVSLLLRSWQEIDNKLTFIKPRLATEVEKGGNGGAKYIGVENASLDASSSKREGKVH